MYPCFRTNLLGASFMLCLSALAHAQVISVRTVPLLSSDQFGVLPSVRDGMGGVEIAVDDEFGDPFINPAKSRRQSRGFVFASPILNLWSFEQSFSNRSFWQGEQIYLEKESDRSRIFTLPFGGVTHGPRFSFGGAMAWQRLSARTLESWQSGPPQSFSETKTEFKATNRLVSLLGACDIPGTALAVGASLNWISIHGVDGVALLYPGFLDLRQDGDYEDAHAGLTFALSERDEINLLGMLHRFHMRQEATYANTTTTVANKDENEGKLLRAEYRRVMTANLRIGLQITGNWKEHPKIPDYPLHGIPRDPGTTEAFDIGLGLGWKNEATLLALDVVYEPIASKTWVEAANDIRTWDERIFRQGEITLRNDYTFSNRILRFGIQTSLSPWMHVRAGTQVRFFEYDFHQQNFVDNSERKASPQSRWTETTITGGATIHTGRIDWLYSGRVILGNGLLSFPNFWRGGWGLEDAMADFFIPPSDWMTVRQVPVFLHQVTLAYRF